ncbi:hypothetical protein GIB67_000158 [Kingdonia uniflora]|uniref:Uncharacterized protein n=1 Tax=Kingdonia uniflora TaxID=39325 RepID=A0A7J7PA96_9MAGN|nr:hypothetical protein GIB67_000158 [Kingdonia uniflora]
MWEYSEVERVGDVHFYLNNQGHDEALDENKGVDHVAHHYVYVEVNLERSTSNSEEDFGYSEEDSGDSRSTDMSGPTNDDMSNPIESESDNMTLDDIVELYRPHDISLGFGGPVYKVCSLSNPVIGDLVEQYKNGGPSNLVVVDCGEPRQRKKEEIKKKTKKKEKRKQNQKENVQKRKGEQAKAHKKKRLRPNDLPEEELDEFPTIYDSDGDIIITEEDKIKNEDYRLRCKYSGKNYEWLLYARRLPNGHTFELTKTSNLTLTCKGKAEDSNKLANTGWVANEIEQLIRTVRTTRLFDVQEVIMIKFGVDISYYTTWNAWSICIERIVGSYDEANTIMPDLTIQVLLANPGSIATCSLDLAINQWMSTYITYKGFIEGFI